jgi:hypothetical protein
MSNWPSHSVTFSLNNPYYDSSRPFNIKVGDKIRLKSEQHIRSKRFQNKKMIARLLKKVFIPYFIVTSLDYSNPFHVSFNIKPYNF